LAWKLALVRAGAASPALLETFDNERRAVGRFNADRSFENSVLVQRINAAAAGELPALTPAEAVEASRRYGNFAGIELGFHYESAAVVSDGSAAPTVADPVIEYIACARPGHRAPHVWLQRPGQRCSTLDLFGPRFTVLAGGNGEAWVAAAKATAQHFGLAIDTHCIGGAGGWQDASDDFLQRYGIDKTGAVLVRPDGHVAFRQRRVTADPDGDLEAALARILACAGGVDKPSF